MMLYLVFISILGAAHCGERSAKSLAYLSDPYIDSPTLLLDGLPQGYSDYDDQLDGSFPSTGGSETNELLSRGRPKPDSPVYYIRLPPTPYMLVPGVGYVSRPPTLRPPPVVQPRPLINLPLSFVSNGKPTGVYTWKPDSPVTNLDKGPYMFNGRPNDIFLLRDTYNTLYEDALQNFYP